MCKKLIEKELTLDTLEAWYEMHRTDFYDGNEEPDLKEQLDNIPAHVQLQVDVYQDEEDKRQQKTFIHNSMTMQARPTRSRAAALLSGHPHRCFCGCSYGACMHHVAACPCILWQ